MLKQLCFLQDAHTDKFWVDVQARSQVFCADCTAVKRDFIENSHGKDAANSRIVGNLEVVVSFRRIVWGVSVITWLAM